MSSIPRLLDFYEVEIHLAPMIFLLYFTITGGGF